VGGEAQLRSETRSRELYERALSLIPGGVSSPVRAMRAVGRDPLFIDSAEGAELIDVDGNRYVDYVCSWGPLILGHAHPDVVAAVVAAAERGTSFGAPTAAEVDLAAEVVARVPSAEMVRFTSSGTEATMTALRLARSATRRDKVLKFSGAYHGHVDGLIADAGSGLATQGIPASPGVTRAQAVDTVIAPWNDFERFDAQLEAVGDELAAVIAEPVPANMGVVLPDEGFLERIAEHTRASGALLIFDEVITGFRVDRGGAQKILGVLPDLTVLGKVLGGGLPLAAVAGPRELMERLAPAGDTYQAGTLSGNPLATAAGLATLARLEYSDYDRLSAYTMRLAEGLRRAAVANGVSAEVVWASGLLTVFLNEREPRNWEDVKALDADAYGRFFRAMLERGIYLPPSPYEAWFPSLAHGEGELERTLAAAEAAFAAAA
jgi:glutamate-1-semialdehyde 2,1-aminomutase